MNFDSTNMMNLQVLSGLLTAMQQQKQQQQQQQQQLQISQGHQPQSQTQQQQQPTPQQLAAFNQFMAAQMIPNFRFPFMPMLPLHNHIPPGTPMSSTSPMNDPSGRKLTPKVNKETAAPLQEWFDSHLDNPYPSEEDMRSLKIITGFTDTQLGDWFRNKRRNYKKTHQGNVPWQIPTTTVRKRRASSISNHHLNDSSSSPDSLSTAHSSSPPLALQMPSTPTTTTAMPSPSAYSFLLAALSTPALNPSITEIRNQATSSSSPETAAASESSSSHGDENVDVETVEEDIKPSILPPPPLIKQELFDSEEQQEPSASSPPEKRAKL